MERGSQKREWVQRFACVALFVACSKGASAPDHVALQYERQRVRGDVAQSRVLLSPSDEQELAAGRAKAADAHLDERGIPSAVVDSAHIIRRTPDSATVAVFYTGPNLQQAFAGIVQQAFSGKKLDERSGKEALAAAPRITLADTVNLLHTPQGWRIDAGLARARVRRDSLAARAKAVGDSLVFDVAITGGVFGGFIRGTATNPTSSGIEELRVEVTDAKGDFHTVNVGEIAPRGHTRVIDVAQLSPGRPAKITVQILKLADQ
jgi:hypothetical protein